MSGVFARSKIAWKLATYQHVLLHRSVALMDGAAVAWNAQSTLSAILTARAFMETLAVMAEFEGRVARFLAEEDLGALDALAQHGIFASRDPEWTKEFAETKAVNVLTYIDKFDERASGFRGHYDSLSERCQDRPHGRLIYRHTALVHATYSINVVFLAITKAASPLLARLRHAGCIEQCPLSGVTRKTFAHTEFFSV